MQKLPAYLLMICAVLLFASALFQLFALIVGIVYKVETFDLPVIVRYAAVILTFLLTSFIIFRRARRMLKL